MNINKTINPSKSRISLASIILFSSLFSINIFAQFESIVFLNIIDFLFVYKIEVGSFFHFETPFVLFLDNKDFFSNETKGSLTYFSNKN